MDDAVFGGDVGLHDFRVVDGDAVGAGFDVQLFAVGGLGLHRFDIGGHDFAGHDVIGEDRSEFGFVFGLEQIFDRALRELGEGFIGGRENGEGAGALERFDKASGFDGGDERFKAAGAGGHRNDVLVVIGADLRGHGDEGERARHGENFQFAEQTHDDFFRYNFTSLVVGFGRGRASVSIYCPTSVYLSSVCLEFFLTRRGIGLFSLDLAVFIVQDLSNFMKQKGYHSIRVVAKRTGLSAHVLRVWERRYGAVEPSRTETNRRLYTDEQVERFLQLAAATRAGHSIKDIANLPSDKLRKLAAESSVESVAPKAAGAGPAGMIAECIAAVKRLDAAALEDVLMRGSAEFGAQGFSLKVLAPMVTEIGELWRQGEITAAHEHFATAVIRLFLANATRPYGGAADAPVVVVATPAGQLHELGALLAALVAANLGWNVKYLGGSLPAGEIAGIARQTGARAVALSIVYPEDDQRLAEELSVLRKLVGDSVAIFVGGRAAMGYRDALKKTGAIHCQDVKEFGELLDRSRARENVSLKIA